MPSTETIAFNTSPIREGLSIVEPAQDEIKHTPSLVGADLRTAMLHGGDLTREALSAMDIRGDKRFVVVDTKVHMLMRGFMPAIPGWHTDAAPRGPGYSPVGPNPPDVAAQRLVESPRFHLLVTGDCRTDFVATLMDIEVPLPASTDLYASMSRQVNEKLADGAGYATSIPSCTVVEWDWWNIHTAVPAPKAEWRFLIRVTETDFQEPSSDLNRVLRTQQQVYVPSEFGW